MKNQKSSIDKIAKKDNEISSFKTEMFTEAIVQNPVLVSTIGLCPVVAISTTLKSAILLSVITYLTMIFSQVLTASLLKKFPQWTRVALYTLCGMAIVAPYMLFMQKLFPEDMIALGIYLPLLAINPLITRQCERVAVKSTVKHAFFNAVSSASGYSAVLIITGLVREIFGSGKIWGYNIFINHPATALTNPFGGFIVIGFMAAALRWYFKKIDPQYAEELAIHSRTSIKKSRNNKDKTFDEKIDENEPQRFEPAQDTQNDANEIEITQEIVEEPDVKTEESQSDIKEPQELEVKVEKEETVVENKKIEFTSQELEELMNKSLDDIINGTTKENQNDADLSEEVPEK